MIEKLRYRWIDFILKDFYNSHSTALYRVLVSILAEKKRLTWKIGVLICISLIYRFRKSFMLH